MLLADGWRPWTCTANVWLDADCDIFLSFQQSPFQVANRTRTRRNQRNVAGVNIASVTVSWTQNIFHGTDGPIINLLDVRRCCFLSIFFKCMMQASSDLLIFCELRKPNLEMGDWQNWSLTAPSSRVKISLTQLNESRTPGGLKLSQPWRQGRVHKTEPTHALDVPTILCCCYALRKLFPPRCAVCHALGSAETQNTGWNMAE